MSRILDKLGQLHGKLQGEPPASAVSQAAPTPVLKAGQKVGHRHSVAAILRRLVGNTPVGRLGILVGTIAFFGGILLVSVTVLMVPPPRANGRLPASIPAQPQSEPRAQLEPSAPAPAPAQKTASTAESESQILEQARGWIAQGRAEAAMALLERTTGQNPKWKSALLLLSAEYRKQGRLDRSAGALVRTLQVDPDSAIAYNNLGMIQMRNKKPQSAIPYFERAFKISPDSPELMLNMAIAYEQVQDWRRAAESYERYLRIVNPEGTPSRDKLLHAARFRMHRLRAWARAGGQDFDSGPEASRALAGEADESDDGSGSDPQIELEDEP